MDKNKINDKELKLLSKEKIYEHCAAAIGCSMSAYKKYVLSLHNPDSPSYEKHNANIHKQEVIDFYNNL